METVLQLSIHPLKHSRWSEPAVELTKRLLLVQKDLGLRYTHELTSISLSLFTVLVQSELEHEQISVLKVIIRLLKWKTDSGSKLYHVYHRMLSLIEGFQDCAWVVYTLALTTENVMLFTVFIRFVPFTSDDLKLTLGRWSSIL